MKEPTAALGVQETAMVLDSIRTVRDCVPASSWAELVGPVQQLAGAGHRSILGIAGPPGAGKSTLAGHLVAAAGPAAALVAMDGFHLANAELCRLGRADRKGAPDTFDVHGYLALLRRLRYSADEPVYAPRFDRGLEEPVAGSVLVDPGIALVVTEGNYLLLAEPPWSSIRPLLDFAWYCELAEAERLRRLEARHRAYGKSPAAAAAWAHGPDQRNARLVQSSRSRADLVVDYAALGIPAPAGGP